MFHISLFPSPCFLEKQIVFQSRHFGGTVSPAVGYMFAKPAGWVIRDAYIVGRRLALFEKRLH
jgi:hypothetical protein